LLKRKHRTSCIVFFCLTFHFFFLFFDNRSWIISDFTYARQ
jgi:hypothetical protein